MNLAFGEVIGASREVRAGLFATTGQRLGTSASNIEKDFWVCWILDALYHRLPPGQPRMLFKGGTSLSKACGLIERFSEDIDITVFREDLGQSATVAELEALSGKKRQEKLDAIRDAYRAYITGPLRECLAGLVADATSGAGRVEIDQGDTDSQTLLVWYPEVEPRDGEYVQPAVKIESGAKSALDPHRLASITPYISEDVPGLDLSIPNVTTIEARRTLWDKIVILHGMRRWFENRGELKGGGHRISRHYYDLHQLMQSPVGEEAISDAALGADCVEHARMFFNRAPFDLASARPPTFALVPKDKKMLQGLARDYEAMRAMTFGDPPTFEEIVETVASVESVINSQ